MVVRRRKKVRKMRGSRTHGYGRVGQHRKGGQRGGKGKAGRHKHLWSYVVKYEPDYFGKHGFHRPFAVQRIPLTINIGELDEMVDLLLDKGYAEKVGDVIKMDLTKLHVDKLLGNGKVRHKFHIIVNNATEKAIQKIKAAGGNIEISEKENSEEQDLNE